MNDDFFEDYYSSSDNNAKNRRHKNSNAGSYQIIPQSDDTSSRRPTSRPVSSQRPYNSSQNRTPIGRKMSDINAQNSSSNRPLNNYPQRSHPQQRQAPQRSSSSSRPSYGSKKPSGNGFKRVNSRTNKKGKKIAVAIICVILAIILAVGAYGFSVLGKINYADARATNEYISSSKLVSDNKVKNILIIGSDARGDIDGMRSDSMILASIDTKNHQLKLTSFLRDSLVFIPSRQNYNKLNAAFSFGGAQLLIDTIEFNFKVKIDNYVIIDFEIFTKFIDALGGVDVSGITQAEVDWLKSNVKGINIHKGTSHLTGGAALWYCRVRKIDTDFKRTERQRKVVNAVISQIKHTNPATTLKAISSVAPLLSTDIQKGKLMSLGINAILRYMNYDMFQTQVPADGTWWDATYRATGMVLEMKIDKNAEILKEFIYTKQSKNK